jgi:hypothetical protein
LALAYVSGKRTGRAKGGLQKTEGLLPTGACADDDKSAVICDVTSRSADYVKTQLETSQN